MNPPLTSPAPVITIDGPSSSGKGTIGRLLARELGWHFLDSGALYRALAWKMQQKNISPNDRYSLEALVQNLCLEFKFLDVAQVQVILNGEDATKILLSEGCGNGASQIAALPHIRALLLQKQRDFRQLPGLVADGRDMGTVVFPDADLKFFLFASLKERAYRRYLQLKEQEISVSLDIVEAELEARDNRDKNRAIAPLKSAEDAVLVDTTGLDIPQVLESIIDLARKRLSFGGAPSSE